MTNATRKEIGLAFSSCLISLVLFSALAWAVANADRPLLLIPVAVVAVVWVMVTAITLFMARHAGTSAVVCLVAMVATVAAGQLSWGSIGGSVLLGIFCSFAWPAFKRDASKLRRYGTADIFSGGTRLLVTGLILAAAGIALPWLQGKIAQEGLQLTAKQVEFVLRPLQPLLRDYLPTEGSASSVDSLIDTQLRQRGIDPTTLSAAERQAIHQQLAQQFSTTVTGHESIADVVTSRLNGTLRRLTQSNALTIALVGVVLAFLTLRAFIPAVSWVIVAGIAAAIWLARRAGLVVTVQETITTETVTL